MNFDPAYINNFILVITGFGGAFIAALWVSLIIWTYKDIKSRARDNLVFILATLIVALLSLPGFLIYLVLRPQFTLEEEYQKTLEEEALLQAIEDHPFCPGCERRIQLDWQVCPNCHTKLRKSCHNCGKLMDLPWNVCPFCATPDYGIRKEESRIMDDVSIGSDIQGGEEDLVFESESNLNEKDPLQNGTLEDEIKK